MNHTTNYQLSQWVKSDKVQMEDFNADNAKIDEVLGTHTTTLAGLTAAVAKLGDCQIYFGSYMGTGEVGEANPKSLTFPCTPVLILIVDVNGAYTLLFKDNYNGSSYRGGAYAPTTSWSSNTVTWQSNGAEALMNVKNHPYRWIALCSKS